MSGREVKSNASGNGSAAVAVPTKFEVTTLPVADVDRAKAFYQRLGWRLDIDFKPSPDTRGVQFTPPGSKVHAFGDGSETKPDPRVFRAFANRMVSPRAAWYVANLPGIEDSLSVVQAPYPMPVAGTTLKIPPSNSAYYPSTGWVWKSFHFPSATWSL